MKSHSWRRLKWARILTFAMWIGWVPAGVVAVIVLPKQAMPLAYFAFMGLWFAVWVIAWMRWTRFICPGCGEKFFDKKYAVMGYFGSLRALFGDQCVNCGIREQRSEDPNHLDVDTHPQTPNKRLDADRDVLS